MSIRLIYAFFHLLDNLELPIQNGLIVINEFPKVQKWLDSFLKSSILEEIMVSHEVWKKDNPAIFFPINL